VEQNSTNSTKTGHVFQNRDIRGRNELPPRKRREQFLDSIKTNTHARRARALGGVHPESIRQSQILLMKFNGR
jgi:hypothetical protein